MRKIVVPTSRHLSSILEVADLALGLLLPLHPLVPDHPQRQCEANDASRHRDQICRAVTLETINARALAVGADDAVLVKNDSIEQVEDVAGDDGRHGHEAPVLRQPVDAKALGHDGGEHPEEETVSETRQAGNETQKVRVHNVESADLADEKYGSGDKETPHPAGVEHFDQEIGSDA